MIFAEAFESFKRNAVGQFYPLKEGTKKNRSTGVQMIKRLAELALNRENSIRINKFLESINGNHYENIDALFSSQKLMNYISQESLCLYGFFNWKTESQEFDYFIRQALKDNFKLQLKENICNLSKKNRIHHIYKIYGQELEKLQVKLCLMDAISDNYTIMLIRYKDYYEFKKIASNFEKFKMKEYKEQW